MSPPSGTEGQTDFLLKKKTKKKKFLFAMNTVYKTEKLSTHLCTSIFIRKKIQF